jgi:hypothetical protein
LKELLRVKIDSEDDHIFLSRDEWRLNS